MIDTNVVSFFLKEPNADSRAAIYEGCLIGTIPVISFMTLAELFVWERTRGWGSARRGRMRDHLGKYVVAPFNETVCEAWADIKSSAKTEGHPITDADAWVAATALSWSVPLLTHNPHHFRHVPALETWSAEDGDQVIRIS